jgi:hypothetical protein
VPQGQSGQVRKISLPPGFEPRTAQPVASSFIDYATRPTPISEYPLKNRGVRELQLFVNTVLSNIPEVAP